MWWIINKENIAKMKDGVIIINNSRGPIVVEQDLADALNSGHLAAAAADVFEMEPPIPREHPLLNAKNCLVTPHIAFASEESMLRRAEIVFDNLYAFLHGEQKNVILPR